MTEARDGGLRAEFRKRFPTWQWTSIETYTRPGVPDSEYCSPRGAQGWIEFKRTREWKVTFESLQPAWIHQRARYGGRVHVAVRRRPIAKKWAGRDELWLVPGLLVLELSVGGLKAVQHQPGVRVFEGGPAGWDWGQAAILLGESERAKA